jgi:hypothetical protein
MCTLTQNSVAFPTQSGHPLPWPVQNNLDEDRRSLVQQWWNFCEVVQHHAGTARRVGIASLRSFGGFQARKELIRRYFAAGRSLDTRRQFPRWPIDAASDARNRASINSDTITKAGVIEAVLCHPI